jgi:Fis family transcriptional regulator, factor for inversion stimulation protein
VSARWSGASTLEGCEGSMSKKQIEECVRASLEGYFRDLRGTEPDGLYEMLVKVVEKPLLEVVMVKAEHNQSKAAEWLGLNRNTLRKKLVEHRLLKP